LKKLNKYQTIGLLVSTLFLLSSRFAFLPDLIEGFCAGIGIALILTGFIADRFDLSKFRNIKLSFIRKCLNK